MNDMLRKLLVAVLLLAHSQTQAQSTELDTVINSEKRQQSSARDQFRHPKETLSFFGVDKEQHVLEVWPGMGWYSEILAPWLQGSGKLYAATYRTDQLNSSDKRLAYRSKVALEFRQTFDDKSTFGEVQFLEYDPTAPQFQLNNVNVDTVLLFRLLHVWDEFGYLEQGFADMYKVLKPGGVLGVVQHRGTATSKISSTSVDGYLSEDYVVKAALAAGFVLEAKSEINANPKDTKDYPRGVYTLPPTLAMGEYDKAKYLDIGESDRMTLKFVKPE
jgi:predicted methyltransferase